MFDLRQSCTQLKGLLFGGDTFVPSVLEDVLLNRRERRRSTRVEMEVSLTARTFDNREFHGFCRDLSREGAAAIIWGKLAVGDRVNLICKLSSEELEVTMPAVIRHVAGYRYGLEFCPEDDAELNRFLVDACCAFA